MLTCCLELKLDPKRLFIVIGMANVAILEMTVPQT